MTRRPFLAVPYAILLVGYVISCLLLPAVDVLSVKKILFLAILALFAFELLVRMNVTSRLAIVWRSVLLITVASLSLVFYLLFGLYADVSALGDSLFLLTSISTVLIAVVYSGRAIDALRIFEAGGLVLSFVVIGMAFIEFINPAMGLIVDGAFLRLNSGYVGFRQFGPLRLTMIHFRTSPVLIVCFVLSFGRFVGRSGISRFTEFSRLCILGGAVFLSASRGIMLFSLLGITALAFWNAKNRRYLRYLILLACVVVIALPIVARGTDVLSVGETSNSIKLGHIESFNRLADREPTILLWGRGLGSSYYSQGFEQETFQTEATFFDMLRYWGIPVTVFTLSLIMLPWRRKVHPEIVIGFTCYFLNAMTNPLIFNSTGMLVIVVYWLSQAARPQGHIVLATDVHEG